MDRIKSLRASPECIVVVNAGTSVPWSAVRRAGIPYIGEALGFVKVTDIMYRNTTAVRVRDLSQRFEARRPVGLVVDMADAPDAVIDGYLIDTNQRGPSSGRVRQLLEAAIDDQDPRS